MRGEYCVHCNNQKVSLVFSLVLRLKILFLLRLRKKNINEVRQFD